LLLRLAGQAATSLQPATQNNDAPMQTTHSFPSKGFTLIELAIVMSIVALLIGSMAIPLSKRIEMQAYADTQATLDKAVEALTGFAILNGRLPCPSIGADGVELPVTADGANWVCGPLPAANSDNNTNPANTSWGDLPWSTLGLIPTDGADAWNYRLRYSVRTNLAAGAAGTNLLTATALAQNGIGIFNPATATPVITPIASPALFVIYSLGMNNAGGALIGGTVNTTTPDPTSAGELANLPNNVAKTTASNIAAPSAVNMVTARNIFASQVRTNDFDDLLVWMSPNIMISKLSAVGRYFP
jgi:prepilin-type N-terminal cleavage/methylation domain-containing protein